jgi:galactose mutarotase-like enzyme
MFNLWGNPREGYFSPEPWIGIQNSLNLDGGTIRLDPGANWTWLLFIEIATGNHSDPPVCRSNHREAHVNCV